MKRVKIGDIIRLYGFPGTFKVSEDTRHDFQAQSVQRPNIAFGANEACIVEINGQPVPCLSAPIAPPADDYPHRPLFDYTDGPPKLAQEAIAMWEKVQNKTGETYA